MDFLLKFTLISYASIFFFVIGLRGAFFHQFDLNFLKILLIFIVIATPLVFAFKAQPFQDRLLISAVWTSVIIIGFRFGKKMTKGASS